MKSATASQLEAAPGERQRKTAPLVFGGSPLKAALHRLLRESSLSVEEISWRLRCSPNRLYRSCCETAASAIPFPLERFAALLQISGDYRPLHVLASECNHVAVPLARRARLKKKPAEVLNEIGRRFHEGMANLHKFFDRPAAAEVAALDETLCRMISDLAAIRLSLRRTAQAEIEFEPGGEI